MIKEQIAFHLNVAFVASCVVPAHIMPYDKVQCSPEPNCPRWRAITACLYASHNPDKLAKLPELFVKYNCHERRWYQARVRKYLLIGTNITEAPVEQEPGKPTAPDIINVLPGFYPRATADSSSVTDLDVRRLWGSTEDALAEKSAPERKHVMATPSREQPAVPNP